MGGSGTMGDVKHELDHCWIAILAIDVRSKQAVKGIQLLLD
jgi:uncharacterized UPF0146 family protein